MYCVDSSPGPKYHIDAKITRFGRDGTPAYSMLGRMKAESKFQFSMVTISVILSAVSVSQNNLYVVVMN